MGVAPVIQMEQYIEETVKRVAPLLGGAIDLYNDLLARMHAMQTARDPGLEAWASEQAELAESGALRDKSVSVDEIRARIRVSS